MAGSSFDRALTKLDVKDGDIVFFDLGCIAVDQLAHLCNRSDVNLAGVVFIGICVRHGQTVEDAVFAMSKTELDLLIADKS